MADQLYLSLWYPNFRLQNLPRALITVIEQFAVIAKDGHPDSLNGRILAATAYPVDWTESPSYQRIYPLDEADPGPANIPSPEDAATADRRRIEDAVTEATELLNDDTAYEFELAWEMWEPESAPDLEPNIIAFDAGWRLVPRRVRVIGFGPDFDAASYSQNGHVRIDFGNDTPWVMEDEDLDKSAARKIQGNIEKLLAFTLLVEKNCGISSRLLWTESGEPLAEKLIARLQRLN